ncbi:MAG: MBL fold metallo-hydrolase [Oceanococcaceae bacterium]
MQVHVLGSGSRGNAMVIQGSAGAVLIDCGFSRRRVEERLAAIGIAPDTICGVLVTHEHGDHASGADIVARAWQVPLYATWGTRQCARWNAGANLQVLTPGQSLRLAGLDIQPYAVPHDAAEPVQFVVGEGGQRIGVLSDAGHITAHMREVLAGCDLLLLEANHCPRMLADGPYPPALQRRVGGAWGHLSNAQSSELLSVIDLSRTAQIVLTHLSEQNNTPERAREVISAALDGWTGTLHTATQDQPLALTLD